MHRESRNMKGVKIKLRDRIFEIEESRDINPLVALT
jgi:hypothetical protein